MAEQDITESSASDLQLADAHERRVSQELNEQFEAMRNQARAVFSAISGRHGIRSEEDWQHIFKQSGVDYKTGRFLIERLGGQSYLDPKLTATLTRLRSDLMAGIENPTAADWMMADSAIIAYRNMLRVQGWIGSLCLVVERELFGEAPLSEIHGQTVGDHLEQQISRFEDVLMPLLDRAHRMMARSLNQIEGRRHKPRNTSVKVQQAGQVNVDCKVGNTALS